MLYGNVMGLAADGIGALMYTGAYRVPVPTLTGDVARDLFLVAPVIGVGEVAIKATSSGNAIYYADEVTARFSVTRRDAVSYPLLANFTPEKLPGPDLLNAPVASTSLNSRRRSRRDPGRW